MKTNNEKSKWEIETNGNGQKLKLNRFCEFARFKFLLAVHVTHYSPLSPPSERRLSACTTGKLSLACIFVWSANEVSSGDLVACNTKREINVVEARAPCLNQDEQNPDIQNQDEKIRKHQNPDTSESRWNVLILYFLILRRPGLGWDGAVVNKTRFPSPQGHCSSIKFLRWEEIKSKIKKIGLCMQPASEQKQHSTTSTILGQMPIKLWL